MTYSAKKSNRPGNADLIIEYDLIPDAGEPKMAKPQLYHRRHRDFEVTDKIVIETVPRYKTSGLSGDEWRVSAVAKFYFKGQLVYQTHFRNIETAFKGLPWDLATFCEKSEPSPMEEVLKVEDGSCDQPSCHKKATVYYRLKRLTSAQGDYLDPKDSTLEYYRRFCEGHATRGNCGREDADDNYVRIDPKNYDLGEG